MKARIYNGEWAGNYPQHWLDANQDKVIGGQLVSEWTLTDILPTEEEKTYIKLMFNGSEYYEGATPEEIAEQQANELKAKETEMYKKRTQDGINAYAEISAEFRLAKLSGTITEEAHAHIERMLIPVRNEVLAGQWISGLKELELIGSELIGQQLYDRLHLQISNYINENYSDVLEV